MTLFINYFAQARRPSCLNLAVARGLVCLYAAWKTGTYAFVELAHYPLTVFAQRPFSLWLLGGDGLRLIAWEQGMLVACLLSCAAGWQRAVSSYLAILLLTHLSAVNFMISNEKTFLPIIYFLVFYALDREKDVLTLDAFLERRKNHVRTPFSSPCELAALKWFLVALGLIYFFTGFGKFRWEGNPFSWASTENIQLILWRNCLSHIYETPLATQWLAGQLWLYPVIGYGTLLLECGFLVAILCRWNLTLPLLGLALMHVGILLTMQVNYLSDMGILYLAFLPYDSWWKGVDSWREEVRQKVGK